MGTTMSRFSPKTIFVATVLGLTFLFLPDIAHAAGAGGAMPWDKGLLTISQSFTGPFAYAITMLGLVAGAAMLIFAHHEASGFIKFVAFVVLCGSMLMGANAFANTMGWTGALV